MNQPIIFKGVISSQHFDPTGETIVQVTAPFSLGLPSAAPLGDAYKFEPYCNISLLASDLGNPPLGATVEVQVKLS